VNQNDLSCRYAAIHDENPIFKDIGSN